MKKMNVVFGAILIAVATYFFYYAGSFQTMAGQKDIGPKAFPRGVCVGLIICGILLIITELRKKDDAKVQLFNLKFVIGIASILVYFLLFKKIGFLLDGVFIIAVMMLLLLNEPLKKAWPLIVGGSICVPLALYVIFGIFLKVPLPMGILSGLFK